MQHLNLLRYRIFRNRKYLERQKKKRKHIRFTPEIRQKVEALLLQDYSPEQLVGTLKMKGIDTVSIELIYQHIWSDKKANGTQYLHLRRRGREYQKKGSPKRLRGIIKNRIGIKQGPSIVDKKNLAM